MERVSSQRSLVGGRTSIAHERLYFIRSCYAGHFPTKLAYGLAEVPQRNNERLASQAPVARDAEGVLDSGVRVEPEQAAFR